jgi:peptidyl-prolyl cis-trans isomerase SurA
MDDNFRMQTYMIPESGLLAHRLAPEKTAGTIRDWKRKAGDCEKPLHRPPLRGGLGLLAVLGLLLLAVSCRHTKPTSPGIWAEVDGQPILRDQVLKVYHSRFRSSGEAGDKEEALSFELNILNELINNQILLAHASHSGITVSEAEVDTKVSQIESPFSKQEFEARLKQRGMDESDLREEVRNSLMVNKLINKDIVSRISVSEADIAAYYQKNRASFNVPETEYHLAQIEVTPRADSDVRNLKNDDAKTAAAAERKIKALYAELRAGQEFAAVAQEYSEDPTTASTGGDMGFIPASGLEENPALKRVVKSLKVGQISGIIKTKNAYHIIKLLGIEQAGQGQLSDPKVQDSIRQTLVNEKEQLLKAAYIETLRDQAKVENFLAQQIVDRGAAGVH